MKKLQFFTLLFLLNGGSVWAMAAKPANPDAPAPPRWTQFVPIAVMVGVFYMFLIRPQTQQKKKRDEMISALKKGDRVVTQGGFIVTIVNLTPSLCEVKLNSETRAFIERSAINGVYTEVADNTTNMETTAKV